MTHEQRLVDGLRAGDETAFDELYEAYRARLWSYLVRLTRQPALAEDLLQETFLRVAGAAPRLAADTRLGPWLFTVARNVFISHQRWALLDMARLSELRLFALLEGPPESPFARVAAVETERRLEQALGALPLPYREVVLLVAVEGMTPAEAAVVLSLQAAAVRQRLARARAMMRASLESADDEGGPPSKDRAR